MHSCTNYIYNVFNLLFNINLEGAHLLLLRAQHFIQHTHTDTFIKIQKRLFHKNYNYCQILVL